ncbi:Na+/H+ antiporter NhaA [Edaphobacter sp. HDX4]|uniref:Na+/H+ antiporter NhaA n=1 Tax=Edaphobacter sp. HDX4 TaxID=2794064 RepID=UPI002FE59D40
MASQLPQIDHRPVRRLVAPFVRFVQLESAGSIVLLAAAVAALTLANSPLAPLYFSYLDFPIGFSAGSSTFQWTAHFWVNDGLMAIFFLSVGLEVKRELRVGELTSVRRALLPVLAALGGVVVPALLYILLNHGSSGASGWGIPIATDIAFSLAVLAVFGSRVPVGLKIFLVTLAIVDDIAGVVVIATAYTRDVRLGYLAIALAVFLVCVGMNRLGVKQLTVYLLAGIAMWCAMHASGVHATLAGVLLALAIPTRTFLQPDTLLDRGKTRLDEFARSVERKGPRSDQARHQLHKIREGLELSESPLDRLQAALHPWVSFVIMPLFAFTNAGIPLSGIHAASFVRDPVFYGVLLGLVLGKPAGITLLSWLAVRLRLAELPAGISFGQLHAVSWLGGIGFTISIFIAGLAFRTDDQYTMARIAVLLASVSAAGLGTLLVAKTCVRPVADAEES